MILNVSLTLASAEMKSTSKLRFSKNPLLSPSSFSVNPGPKTPLPNPLLVNKDLKGEVQVNKEQLAACNEQNYMKDELTKLISIVEQMSIHFDFTLAIIASKSEEEVEQIKERFASINKQYENVKSKDNLSPYAAKAALGIFHDKMLLELKRVSKKCFIKVKKGSETRLVQKDDNLALIQIMVNYLGYKRT